MASRARNYRRGNGSVNVRVYVRRRRFIPRIAIIVVMAMGFFAWMKLSQMGLIPASWHHLWTF